MIVNHSGGLHQRIAGCGSDETETHLLQRLAHLGAGLDDRGEFCHALSLIDDRLTVDKTPKEGGESIFIRTEIINEDFGIVDGRPYLGLVANDTSITEQTHHIIIVEGSDLGRVEPLE